MTKHKAVFMVCGGLLVQLVKGLSRVQARAVQETSMERVGRGEFLVQHWVRGEDDGDALHTVEFAGTRMTLVGSLCCCCSLWKRKKYSSFSQGSAAARNPPSDEPGMRCKHCIYIICR